MGIKKKNNRLIENSCLLHWELVKMSRCKLFQAYFSILGIFFLSVAVHVRALARSELYPYDTPDAVSLKSDPNGMIVSDELHLQTPMVLYDRKYKNVYVSSFLFFFSFWFIPDLLCHKHSFAFIDMKFIFSWFTVSMCMRIIYVHKITRKKKISAFSWKSKRFLATCNRAEIYYNCTSFDIAPSL